MHSFGLYHGGNTIQDVARAPVVDINNKAPRSEGLNACEE
jgi:hypothetical protein